MPYIGKTPLVGAYQLCDAITTSATATYNLTVGTSPVIPGSAQNCIVSLNGVIQAPVNAFTVSGSQITFSSALTSTDVIDFILILGNVLDVGKPTDGTVTPSSIQAGTSGLFTWQSVQTSGFTAAVGKAYPCNTTSAAFTVTLPASPNAGDQILLLDYAGTFDTNVLTINPNGNKIEGGTSNLALTGEREGATLTYIDSTQGWLASSGINEGTDALLPIYSVDFLVIAGGGGGGSHLNSGYNAAAGGGGAGGYRNSYSTETSGGGGSSEASLTFRQGTVYTITVGAGGAGGTNGSGSDGTAGSNSEISGTGLTTITSTGGGRGGRASTVASASLAGGSGGGGGSITNVATTGGSGTANQGYAGGNGLGALDYSGGGGGGASAVGSNASGSTGGSGGNGLASSITGSSVTRAGGGGGGFRSGGSANGGTGGGGSGGISTLAAQNGTVNTGSGGGGIFGADNVGAGGAGGSGVVILRMPTANYSGTTTGSPTVTTSGSDTILVFNSSGTITG
jgi:hypothetical protein